MGILDREITGSGISRVGVSGVNFKDPTKSLVDTIAGMQNRKLVEDRQRLAQANADRTFGLQEANAKRQQTIFDRDEAVRQGGIALAAMKSPQNMALQDDINARYNMLASNPGADNYDEKLQAMNRDLARTFGNVQGTASIDPTRAAYALDTDPITFEQQARQKLSTSGMSAPEIEATIQSELATRYPLASAESIKGEKADNLAIFNAKAKALGGGGGVSAGSDGSLVVNGPSRSVATRSNNPKTKDDAISAIAEKDNLYAAVQDLFGNNTATSNTVRQTMDEASGLGDFDSYQLAEGMKGLVKQDVWTKNSLPSANPKDNAIALAKYITDHNIGTRSRKDTTKGGGASGGLTLQDAINEFQLSQKRADARGLRSRTSLPSDFGFIDNSPKKGDVNDLFSQVVSGGNKETPVTDKEMTNTEFASIFQSKDTGASNEAKPFSEVKQEKDINIIKTITKSLEDPTLPKAEVAALVNAKEQAIRRTMLNNLVNHKKDPNSISLVDIVKGVPKVTSGVATAGKALIQAAKEGYFAVDKAQGELSQNGEDFIKGLFTSSADKQLQKNKEKLDRAEYDRNIPNVNPTAPAPGTTLGTKPNIPVATTSHLESKEGNKSTSYLDSVGKLTGGVGHLLTKEERLKYPKGTNIPKKVRDAWFKKDSEDANRSAIVQAKDMGVSDSPEFVKALTSVNFQMGVNWRTKFPKAYAALREQDYSTAIAEVKSSLWAKQTPTRVKEFIAAIEKLRG